jgi:hypothetical protein
MSKNTILNLTMHPAAQAQRAGGVIEPQDKQEVKDLLLFREMPAVGEVARRASALAALAAVSGADAAMIGGAPYLMAPLHAALEARGVRPVYAFSERRSEEVTQPDGSVRKVNVFVHLGFVG